MTDHDDTLSIGRVAARVGLATSAVRYYESIGLIDPPKRVSGMRRYEPSVLHRLSLVVQAQRRGFTLREISALVDSDGNWQQLAETKLAALERDREEIDAMIDLLRGSLECGCEALERCPLLEVPADAHTACS